MRRKYPVGIQSFHSIRTDGYVYVDKTPLIYKMITEGKPQNFLYRLLMPTMSCSGAGMRA